MNKPKRISALFTGTVALVLLVAVSAPHTEREPTSKPDIRPVLAYAQGDRVLPTVEPLPTPVNEKTAKVDPISTFPAEIDFEPQKPSDHPAILTSKEPPRGNPTPEPLLAPTPSQQAPVEPKMGDTRIIDGQKQVYFLGFGWIEDNDTPNECVYVEDMYENGNKVGSIGGGTFVDGDGDINKMVGTMGGGETGRSCGDINKQVGAMD